MSDAEKIDRYVSRFAGIQVFADYWLQAWIGRLRLHVFLAPERGEALHDHPWPFYTFPLRSYREQVLDPDTQEIREVIVPAWRVSYRPAEYTHRIIGAVGKGPVVTICWVGKPARQWGFWRGGKWRPWDRHLKIVERAQ